MNRVARAIGSDRVYNLLAVMLAVMLPGFLVYLAWHHALYSAEQEARTRFDFRAEEIREALSGRMLDYEQVLRGATGLFAASKSVEREEWRSYYRSLKLEAYYPGIQGMGYAPRVLPSEIGKVVAEARATGYPDYELKPAGERETYYPIIYLTPNTERNLRAVGFDMYSSAPRRNAIDEALTYGRASVSGRVTLVQETNEDVQAGFLMYLPVYRKGVPTDDAEKRKAAVQGVVYAAFRAGNLIKGILGDERQMRVAVFDGAEAREDALLYRSGSTLAGNGEPRYFFKSALLIHGRVWTLQMHSTPEFEATIDRHKPMLVLIGGFLIHLLLLAVLWSLWTARERAVNLARSMTREVRRREAEWHAMSDASPLGIFRTDSDGRVNYVNPRFESISGLQGKAALGEGWAVAIHPEDRARVVEEWSEVIRSRAPEMTITFRFLRTDGVEVWSTAQAAEIRDDETITGYVGSIEDITERRLATETLMKSRERLGLALEGSNLAMFDWDVLSGEVHLSEQWQMILGGGKEETDTKIEELQRLVHPDDMQGLRVKLLPVIKGNARFYEVQHRVRSVNGEWRWILSRAKVTERSVEGRALRVVGTNADITESKEVERLKNEFVSTVSHELRTPLTAIIGSLGLVKELGIGMDEEIAGFIDMAYQNSERLSALINDVLDLEKIRSGRMTLDLRPQGLRELLERAVHINRPYADIHKVRLNLLPGPDFTVSVDPDRLMQVLTNLISNAAKFSPEGSEVDVSATAEGNRVRVAVRDRGPGIPENFRAAIFQRFERADSSNTRRKGGTGLGLSISKSLVEYMNGEIGFETEIDRGSVFYFLLPVVGAAQA